MSPNTKRSPATVPDRLATSSALPVTRPVAKRLAKCDAEPASATASLTRFDSSSLTAMPLSRASSTKLLARSESPAARAASMFSATSAWLLRRAELIWISDSAAGSSCAARMAPASRACGHSAAHTATLSAMPARAEPSRNRLIQKSPMFSSFSRWYAVFKTQPPRRKKGFSPTTRLCRICMSKCAGLGPPGFGSRNHRHPPLWCAAFRGCRVVLIASAHRCYPR